MDHPEISKMNASLYYAKRLKEAEDYRQARKFTSRQPKGNFFKALREYLPVLNGEKLGKSIQSQA